MQQKITKLQEMPNNYYCRIESNTQAEEDEQDLLEQAIQRHHRRIPAYDTRVELKTTRATAQQPPLFARQMHKD